MGLLTRFIAFFAIMAVILTLYAASYPEGSESLGPGWPIFTAMAAGPQQYLPPTIATPSNSLSQSGDLSNQYSVMYFNKSLSNPCAYSVPYPDTGYIGPMRNAEPQSTDYIHMRYDPTPPYYKGLYFTYFMSFGGSGITLTEGDWTLTTYWSPDISANVNFTFEVMIAGLDSVVNSCTPIGPLMVYNTTISFVSDGNPAVIDPSVKQIWHVKNTQQGIPTDGGILVQIVLTGARYSDGSFAPNEIVRFVNSPGQPAKLNSPSAGATDKCFVIDPFCRIGGAVAAIASAFVFILYMIAWCTVSIFIIFAWISLIGVVLIGALFLISLSGAFGAFGPFIAVINLMFLVTVIFTVLKYVRGTSGSLGV